MRRKRVAYAFFFLDSQTNKVKRMTYGDFLRVTCNTIDSFPNPEAEIIPFYNTSMMKQSIALALTFAGVSFRLRPATR